MSATVLRRDNHRRQVFSTGESIYVFMHQNLSILNATDVAKLHLLSFHSQQVLAENLLRSLESQALAWRGVQSLALGANVLVRDVVEIGVQLHDALRA